MCLFHATTFDIFSYVCTDTSKSACMRQEDIKPVENMFQRPVVVHPGHDVELLLVQDLFNLHSLYADANKSTALDRNLLLKI